MTPPTSEDLAAQLPALRTLIGLGYSYLTAEELDKWRGGNNANVLLTSVLSDQLRQLNKATTGGVDHPLTAGAIDECVRALANTPLQEGLNVASANVFDLLTEGHTVKQTIDGNTRAYSVRYIDWIDTSNNAYHVAEEVSVRRGGSRETYRPDLVLYVNGIPFAVIEAKAPHLENPMRDAIRQHARNQQPDGIRELYKYVQLLGGISVNQAKYATVDTPEQHWSIWRERPYDFLGTTKEVLAKAEQSAQNSLLSKHNQIRLADAKAGNEIGTTRAQVLKALLAEQHTPTAQTQMLLHVFRPDRMLELAKDFTVFDAGIRKVARYQQFFAVKASLDRVLTLNAEGRREGGVVWHTQGSGKSLTMVMLAKALLDATELKTRDIQIIIVTDRVDLDDQIYKTFQNTGLSSEGLQQAKTGTQLQQMLSNSGRKVITTIINKFETVIAQIKQPITSPDVFVLIDEGHRTQYGRFGASLQRSLPNACAIAFTGTPIRKKHANTTGRFGDYIDKYRIGEAVKDGAVVELIYEDRYPLLEIDETAIQKKYDRLTSDMTRQQLAEFDSKNLQKKLWLATQQRLDVVVDDIYTHYTTHWNHLDSKGDGTGKRYRAQLVTQSKLDAVRYYNLLRKKEKGGVKLNVGLLISAPDMREGHEDASAKTSDEVIEFWKSMMDRYGKEEKYSKALITGFKYGDGPDIIIVVDKLLTGFDAPYNTILYLDKNLKDHTLLQAITRVNRTAEGKKEGYLIDYRGVLLDLKKALAEQYEEEEAEEILQAFKEVSDELDAIPERHAEVAEFFRGIKDRADLEAYIHVLRADDVRQRFYRKLRAFVGLMHTALASASWLDEIESTERGRKNLQRYKADRKFWLRVRELARKNHAESIDFGSMENDVRRILDAHINVIDIERLGKPINIFDETEMDAAVAEFSNDEAKADKIASETSRHLTENMDRNKSAYMHYAAQLKAAIDDYHEQRINAAEFLKRVKAVRDSVAHGGHDDGVPAELRSRPKAMTLYSNISLFEGIKNGVPDATVKELLPSLALKLELAIQEAVTVNGQPIVDWRRKSNILSDVELEIFDALYDSGLFAHYDEMPTHLIGQLARELVETATHHF